MRTNESEPDETDSNRIGRTCSNCGGRYFAVTIKGPGGVASLPCCGVTVHVAPTTIERTAAERASEADREVEAEARTDGGVSTWGAAETVTTRAELYETPETAEARHLRQEAREAAERARDDGHDEATATAVSNAVHDALVQDDEVQTLMRLKAEAYDVADENEDSPVGEAAFEGAESLRKALDWRVGIVVREAESSVVGAERAE